MKTVWRWKFQPPRGGFQKRQSNVDLALLNPQGILVHTFDAARNDQYGRRGAIQQYTAAQLHRAAPYLGLNNRLANERPVKLPDLGGERGIRLLVSLGDERMPAYRAPVVALQVPLRFPSAHIHLADVERYPCFRVRWPRPNMDLLRFPRQLA